MVDEKRGYQKQEQLEGKPDECSTEQIKKCHGDVKDHPCVAKIDGSKQ